MLGITTMTILFLLCGSLGYAAFGDHTPGNILTGFGFYEPFLLVALGNVCIIVHMVGAYQVIEFLSSVIPLFLSNQLIKEIVLEMLL